MPFFYAQNEASEIILNSVPHDPTKVNLKKLVYTWPIENFSSWLAEGVTVRYSSPFPAGSEGEAPQWRLEFYPRASTDEAYCSLYLCLLVGPKNLDAQIEINVMNYASKLIVKYADEQRFQPGSDGWGWENLTRSDHLLGQTRCGDKLVIVCTIRNMDRESKGSTHLPVQVSNESLSASMNTVLDEGKFGDVMLTVKGRLFPAYKGILAARSSVFYEMFLHQTKPANNSFAQCVEIRDIEPAIFQELLRYIYTDRVDNLSPQMVCSLHTAAERFKLPALQEMCQHWIWHKHRG